MLAFKWICPVVRLTGSATYAWGPKTAVAGIFATLYAKPCFASIRSVILSLIGVLV
jgi:hypothetical protein